MPSKNRRIKLTMTESLAHSFRVIGLTPTANPDDGVPADGVTQVTAALARYADAIERANRELERLIKMDEWNAMADSLNGCADIWEHSESPLSALALIRAQIEDCHQLNGLGNKWFGDEDANKRVKALLSKLSDLTPVHGDAIIAAVRHFWRHPEINHGETKWWSVDYRTGRSRTNAART